MANVNYPDKTAGSSVTSQDMNQIKLAVNSKLDEDDVGGEGGLIRADQDGLVPVEQVPTVPALQQAAQSENVAAAGNAVRRIARAGTEEAPWATAEEVIERMSREEESGPTIPISAIAPMAGFKVPLIDISEITDGTTFRLRLNRQNGSVILLEPDVDEVNAALPGQMLSGTHFSTPIQYESGNRIDINVVAAPASSSPVLSYVVTFDGSAHEVTIPVGAAMPFSLLFTPELYREIWQWGAPTWNASFRIGAVSATGRGPVSAPIPIPIDQDDGYFYPDDDWSFAEERNPSVAGGSPGRPRTTISVSRVTPDDVELRCYVGPLPYTEANYSEIHSAANSPAITPGANVLGTAGHAVGTPVFAILLYREANTARWHPASLQKTFVVEGLIPVGAPTLVMAPTQGGNGKIGSLQSVTSGTWTGAPVLSFAWLRDGLEIEDADEVSYLPTVDDDVSGLSCRITATNAGGSTSYTTPAVPITYPKPTVAAGFGNKVYTQQSSAVRSESLAGVFAGAGFEISVKGPTSNGVPICAVNSAEGLLGTSISNILGATVVELIATNSGGSVSTTFSLTISAAAAVAVPEIIAVGGSNTSGKADFEQYITDDMIVADVRQNSSAAFTVPDLPAFSGERKWNVIFLGGSSGQYQAICYRRCAGIGSDGDLGDWGAARPTYITIRGVDWADPIGAISTLDPSTWQPAGTNLDHPGLPLEGLNSLVLDIAHHASAIAGQAPGLRPGATLVAQNTGSGARKTISRSTAVPATAWPAAADVDHTVAGPGNSSGVQFAAAIEIKGAPAAANLVWPPNIPVAKILASEVTSPTVAAAQGFPGESGHVMVVVASDCPLIATTASGDFELVREYMGGEVPAPAATGNLVAAGTWYSGTTRALASYVMARALWRHKSSGAMRVAWSAPPIEITGLEGGVTTSWPAMTAVGTGVNQVLYRENGQYFYKQPAFSKEGNEGYDTATGYGLKGAAFAAAAYASFAGNTALDAFVLSQLRGCLVGGKEPSLQCGYSSQHDMGFMVAAFFVKNTPRLWTGPNGLTSVERDQIDLLMKAGMIANAAVGREAGESHKNMLGNPNSSTINSNPNIRSAHRLNVMIGCAWFGSAAAGKAFLDSITATHPAPSGKVSLRSIYDALVAYGFTNAAASFHPTRPNGSPSYAFIASKVNGWTTFSTSILDPNTIVSREIKYTFDQECATRGGGRYGNYGEVIGTPSAALMALVNAKALGMDHELNTTDDAQGAGTNDRSSAEYGMWALRVAAMGALVALVSGIVSRTNADMIQAMNQMKVGLAHFREITRDSVGWDDFAQGGNANSGDWYFTLRAVTGTNPSGGYRWGILPFFALADMAIAIMDRSTPPNITADYYLDD